MYICSVHSTYFILLFLFEQEQKHKNLRSTVGSAIGSSPFCGIDIIRAMKINAGSEPPRGEKFSEFGLRTVIP